MNDTINAATERMLAEREAVKERELRVLLEENGFMGKFEPEEINKWLTENRYELLTQTRPIPTGEPFRIDGKHEEIITYKLCKVKAERSLKLTTSYVINQE